MEGRMMDVALAIEALVPAAQYGGSTTANTRQAFEKLDWTDSRPRPDWTALEQVRPQIDVGPGLEPVDQVKERLDALEARLTAVEVRSGS